MARATKMFLKLAQVTLLEGLLIALLVIMCGDPGIHSKISFVLHVMHPCTLYCFLTRSAVVIVTHSVLISGVRCAFFIRC